MLALWNELTKILGPMIIPLASVTFFMLFCGLAAILMRIMAPWLELGPLSFGRAFKIALLSFLSFSTLFTTYIFNLGFMRGLMLVWLPNPNRTSQFGERDLMQMSMMMSSPMTGLLTGAASLAVASLVATRMMTDPHGGPTERVRYWDALMFTCAYFAATWVALGTLMAVAASFVTFLI